MLSQLRKAGDILKSAAEDKLSSLSKFDEQYSDKIREMYADKGPIPEALSVLIGGGSPSFSGKASIPKGPIDIGPYKVPEKADAAVRGLIEYGVPAMNAVPKYVLPAAGVTLAGQALIDTANAIQGAQQTEATLGIDAGQVASASLAGGGLAAGPGIVEMIRTPKGGRGPGRGTVAATAAAGAGAMAGLNAGLQMLFQ